MGGAAPSPSAGVLAVRSVGTHRLAWDVSKDIQPVITPDRSDPGIVWHRRLHALERRRTEVSYGYTGTMRTRSGRRDEVVALLTRDVDKLRSVGCRVYAVAVSDDDPDLVWVYEIWESKAHHDDSLQLPSVKLAIEEAMPMLTGEFSGSELAVVGGLGV